MKPKVHYQVQPRQPVPPRLQPIPLLSVHFASRQMPLEEEVQQEIDTFLQALDSYPARAAKDHRVSFQQHLRSIFEQVAGGRNKDSKNKDGRRSDGRRDAPAGRH